MRVGETKAPGGKPHSHLGSAYNTKRPVVGGQPPVLTTIALFVQRAVIVILVLLRLTLLLKVQQPQYVLP